mmetsp:Transcript_42036/g.42909  ORF Transcript_42036/g.42909 Transcript_42036/m.42909 type:complete len:181 (+) Transcript_42036:16-558(+)
MAPLIEDDFFFPDYVESTDHYENQKSIFATFHQTNNVNTTGNGGCRVSFDDVVSPTVYDVDSLSDFTAQEIRDAWYDGHDLRCMKREARSDARQLMESGNNDNDNDIICFRGLESRTRQGMKQKRQNRTNATTAVFVEINFQKEVGFIDEDAIARAYYVYSNACLVLAQLIAKQDATEAI